MKGAVYTCILITGTIIFSLFLPSFSNVNKTSTMTYYVDPSIINLGKNGTGGYAGSQVTVNVNVSNAVDLYAIDIDFSWNTTWLAYVSHTVKIPVETYPDGVLHETVVFVKDDVDIPGGTYDLTVTSLPPAPLFNGSGIVFEMTLQTMFQPWHFEVPPPPNNYVSTTLHLTESFTPSENGEVRIYASPPTYPSYPMLKVMPETIGGVHVNETFPVDVWLMGGDDTPLDPFWDVSGVDFYLHFNATLIEATNVIIDPYGEFAFFFLNPIVEIAKEINNTAGAVRVAFNATDGLHFGPYGKITIVTVEFKALLEVLEWPPLSCVVGLGNPPPRPVVCLWGETSVYLEGYQHPDRDYCIWNNSDSRVPLPHTVENATYFARFDQGVLVTILMPVMKNHSMETLWLNVTANVPVEAWWYNLNSGSNVSFTHNSTITVSQCENTLVVYASSLGMEGSAGIQFHALTGDLDGDRDVDIFDIVLLATLYGIIQGHPAYKPEYDIYPPPSGDGVLDIFDIVTMAGNYGISC